MKTTNRAEETPIKKMDSDRIKQIQEGTAYPNSVSMQQALLKVWNECAQQSQSEIDELTKEVDARNQMIFEHNNQINFQAKEIDSLTKEVERLRKERELILLYYVCKRQLM